MRWKIGGSSAPSVTWCSTRLFSSSSPVSRKLLPLPLASRLSGRNLLAGAGGAPVPAGARRPARSWAPAASPLPAIAPSPGLPAAFSCGSAAGGGAGSAARGGGGAFCRTRWHCCGRSCRQRGLGASQPPARSGAQRARSPGRVPAPDLGEGAAGHWCPSIQPRRAFSGGRGALRASSNFLLGSRPRAAGRRGPARPCPGCAVLDAPLILRSPHYGKPASRTALSPWAEWSSSRYAFHEKDWSCLLISPVNQPL